MNSSIYKMVSHLFEGNSVCFMTMWCVIRSSQGPSECMVMATVTNTSELLSFLCSVPSVWQKNSRLCLPLKHLYCSPLENKKTSDVNSVGSEKKWNPGVGKQLQMVSGWSEDACLYRCELFCGELVLCPLAGEGWPQLFLNECCTMGHWFSYLTFELMFLAWFPVSPQCQTSSGSAVTSSKTCLNHPSGHSVLYF